MNILINSPSLQDLIINSGKFIEGGIIADVELNTNEAWCLPNVISRCTVKFLCYAKYFGSRYYFVSFFLGPHFSIANINITLCIIILCINCTPVPEFPTFESRGGGGKRGTQSASGRSPWLLLWAITFIENFSTSTFSVH